MTRQLPVMQLQSFSYPKNVSALSSPSLTTSLINNNSLLTFRDIMMHHQYQQQQHERQQKTISENLNESISTASSLPNTSASDGVSTAVKLSPKHNNHHAMEKNEKISHPLYVNKHETCENGSKISVNRSTQNKAEYHHNNTTSARTVREELEASRCKIPKLGEFIILFFSKKKAIIII